MDETIKNLVYLEKDNLHHMGESSSSQAFTFSSSPALALSSPPFSISNSSSTDGAHSFVFNPPASSVESSTLQKLSSNINSLLSAEFDNSFSDVHIYISNCVVPLHRCILAARCPFFQVAIFQGQDISHLPRSRRAN